MDAVVDQRVVEHLILLDEDLDDLLGCDTSEECAHSVDVGVREPHQLFGVGVVHLLIRCDFGHVAVDLLLDTLELLLGFASALVNAVVVVIKETRVSPLLLSELFNAPGGDVPSMASILGLVELPGELLWPLEMVEIILDAADLSDLNMLGVPAEEHDLVL